MSTKYDIHLSFSAVSSRLTHRKRLIQRALDSRDPGESFEYTVWNVAGRCVKNILEAFEVKNVIQNTTKAI